MTKYWILSCLYLICYSIGIALLKEALWVLSGSKILTDIGARVCVYVCVSEHDAVMIKRMYVLGKNILVWLSLCGRLWFGDKITNEHAPPLGSSQSAVNASTRFHYGFVQWLARVRRHYCRAYETKYSNIGTSESYNS